MSRTLTVSINDIAPERSLEGRVDLEFLEDVEIVIDGLCEAVSCPWSQLNRTKMPKTCLVLKSRLTCQISSVYCLWW